MVFGVWAALPVGGMLGPALVELRVEADALEALSEYGLWSSGWATTLIIIGLALGLVIYLVGKGFRTRTVPAYMSGEVIRDDRVRFRGSSFYRTVQELPVIGTMLSDATDGAFDVYYVTGKCGQRVVDVLRSWHTGVLPLYVTWALIGLVVIVLYLL